MNKNNHPTRVLRSAHSTVWMLEAGISCSQKENSVASEAFGASEISEACEASETSEASEESDNSEESDDSDNSDD